MIYRCEIVNKEYVCTTYYTGIRMNRCKEIFPTIYTNS